MGNFLSEESRHSRPARQNEDLHVSSGRKRLNEEADISCSVVIPKETKVKRKRLKTTSQYIYDALFIHGENSDVTIISFNREWKLHKVYPRQAGYFNSMFQASQWMESTMEVINLQIPDDNIDENSLHIAFGSLYSEEVLICPSKVVSILAAASLIQLEGLMQQCTEVMKETVCQDNVCLYYKTACMYGQNEVSETCIKWLETNLMANQCQNLLSELEPKLLADVLRSSDLIVIQIEMDIYTLLKKWLYLRLHPDFSGEFKNILSAADKFFREEAQKCKVIFLESKQGKPYINTFKALRLQHIIRDFVSCREIEKDFIVPMSWLTPLYRQQWLSMLRVEQSLDFGPKVYEKDEFDCNGLRCGRLLVRDAEHCWRWNGYNFGLDLLVSYSSQGTRLISLRRNVHSQRCSASLSLAAQRHILFRVHIASVNEKGHSIFRLSTGSTPITLDKEEEKVVLAIDRDRLPDVIKKQPGGWNSCFPLLITATFQLVQPPDSKELITNGYGILPLSCMSSLPTLGDVETAGAGAENLE